MLQSAARAVPFARPLIALAVAGAMRSAPSADRNKEPIAQILARHPPFLKAPASGRSAACLEIASGTGQHVSHMAARFPHITFQPTEYGGGSSSPEAVAYGELGPVFTSIIAHSLNLDNVRPPVELDAASSTWPCEAGEYDAVYACNICHSGKPRTEPAACTPARRPEWAGPACIVLTADQRAVYRLSQRHVPGSLTVQRHGRPPSWLVACPCRRRSPLHLWPLPSRWQAHGALERRLRCEAANAKPRVGRARRHSHRCSRRAAWAQAGRTCRDACQQFHPHLREVVGKRRVLRCPESRGMQASRGSWSLANVAALLTAVQRSTNPGSQ